MFWESISRLKLQGIFCLTEWNKNYITHNPQNNHSTCRVPLWNNDDVFLLQLELLHLLSKALWVTEVLEVCR